MREGVPFGHKFLAAGLVVGLGVAGLGNVAFATSSPKTLAPIKIGLITDNSGALGPQFTGVAADFMARIAYQNAHGGVNGHTLIPVVADDQTTPQGNLAATQKLVGQDHVAIVDEESSVTAGAAAYLHSAGEPVVGGDYSGPEWGTSPYTNMFGDWGSTDPSAPAYSTFGLVFKELGAKSLGSVGYATIPSSHEGAINAEKAVLAAGLKAPYLNVSVPLGSSNFSSIALGLKNAGADSLYAPLGIPVDVALVTAAHNAGAHLKYGALDGGYAGIVGTASQTLFQGWAFPTYWQPEQFNTSVTRSVQSALIKYHGLAGRKTYDFDIVGWLGATLAITGLGGAGTNPTSASIVASLRSQRAYTANGMLPGPVDMSLFGVHSHQTTDLGAAGCAFAVQLKGSTFVPMNNKKPFCGKKL